MTARPNLATPEPTTPSIAVENGVICGVQEESCGWEGWVLECLKLEGKNIEGDTILLCPKCSQPLFRTAASVKYIPSENQEPALVPGVDYDVVPMEYK